MYHTKFIFAFLLLTYNLTLGQLDSIKIKFKVECKENEFQINNLKYNSITELQDSIYLQINGKELLSFAFKGKIVYIPSEIVESIRSVKVICFCSNEVKYPEEDAFVVFLDLDASYYFKNEDFEHKIITVALDGLEEGGGHDGSNDSKYYFLSKNFEVPLKVYLGNKRINNNKWLYDPSTEICGTFVTRRGRGNRKLLLKSQDSEWVLKMPLSNIYPFIEISILRGADSFQFRIHFYANGQFYE